jgi:hypothetical protein
MAVPSPEGTTRPAKVEADKINDILPIGNFEAEDAS